MNAVLMHASISIGIALDVVHLAIYIVRNSQADAVRRAVALDVQRVLSSGQRAAQRRLQVGLELLLRVL